MRTRAFEEGLATSLDVVDARLSLSRVELERLAAAYEFDVALADLLEASGQGARFEQLLATGRPVTQVTLDTSTRSRIVKATRTILTFLLVAAVVGGLWRWAWKLSQPVPEVIQGQVEGRFVNVSSKIPGRVASVAVREGQTVQKSDPLVVLDSPEIQAKLDQAEAARQAASAQRDKAYNGAREEEIRQARSAWERAQHATELAEKTFRRIDRLERGRRRCRPSAATRPRRC